MMMRHVMLGAGAMIALAAAARPAPAQLEVRMADSLLREGRVQSAEALYYTAVRRRPRDPQARYALGQYLAARNALRVGAVLIEEGRRFGGDAGRATELLTPIYERLEDYGSLLSLQPTRLPQAELARARWLRENPPSVVAPDTARLPLFAASRSSSFGAVLILIGGDTVRADIDPTVSGLVLDLSMRRTPGVRVFEAGVSAAHPGVVSRLAIGPIMVRNAAVTVADAGGAGRARVGLDWFARWAPTLDFRTSSLTLRRSGRVPPAAVSSRTTRLPFFHFLPGADGAPAIGPWVTVQGGHARLGGASLAGMRPVRLTLDPRRGELLID